MKQFFVPVMPLNHLLPSLIISVNLVQAILHYDQLIKAAILSGLCYSELIGFNCFRTAAAKKKTLTINSISFGLSYQLHPEDLLEDMAIDVEGLGLESWTCQVRHIVANGSPPVQRFFGAVSPRH